MNPLNSNWPLMTPSKGSKQPCHPRTNWKTQRENNILSSSNPFYTSNWHFLYLKCDGDQFVPHKHITRDRLQIYQSLPNVVKVISTIYLDIERAVPFIVPLTDTAINIGIIHFNGPRVLSANVWNTYFTFNTLSGTDPAGK